MAEKTIGIYKITSEYDTNFKMLGSSTQIEVCTKDYINWAKKGKAPKVMQEAYDNYLAQIPAAKTPQEFFKVNILKTVDTVEELAAAKVEFGLGTAGGKPVKRAAQPKITATEPIIEEPFDRVFWEEVYVGYKNGDNVKDICVNLGIGTKEFYRNIAKLNK